MCEGILSCCQRPLLSAGSFCCRSIAVEIRQLSTSKGIETPISNRLPIALKEQKGFMNGEELVPSSYDWSHPE